MQLSKLALTLIAGTSLGFALPALAQNAAPAPAADAALPTCSASVTDHCMQRSWHAPAKGAMHHGKKHHGKKHHGHHGGKHHHK